MVAAPYAALIGHKPRPLLSDSQSALADCEEDVIQICHLLSRNGKLSLVRLTKSFPTIPNLIGIVNSDQNDERLKMWSVISPGQFPIDHMQISAPFCFGCGRHIERSFAGSELHSVQVRLHCRVSEFWSNCNVLQELGDSRLSFLRHMAESIDSQGAEQEEVGFHRHFRWLSLLFKLK